MLDVILSAEGTSTASGWQVRSVNDSLENQGKWTSRRMPTKEGMLQHPIQFHACAPRSTPEQLKESNRHQSSYYTTGTKLIRTPFAHYFTGRINERGR